MTSCEVANPPSGLQNEFELIFTAPAIDFVVDLCRKFRTEVQNLHIKRKLNKLRIDNGRCLPKFKGCTDQGDWKVSDLPARLRCRHVDLGDVSPANTKHFVNSLRSSAQGIQTDFDDGHCPTWANQIRGYWNVYRAVHNTIPRVPPIEKAPVLMLRPRAWNMIEHNFIVDGKKVPGPLVDFGMLMFHNGRILAEVQCGPFFYLSKLESSNEAKLWNEIFTYAQDKLGINYGCIKACVLIENILAAFEMEQILYELRDHSAGLNCGMWDYSASIINKFGIRKEFVLPDRSKYVSMDRHFLKSYMDLVVYICHKHGALATGGMAAQLAIEDKNNVKNQVSRSKLQEVISGVDGFMVYDLDLVPLMQDLFRVQTPNINQLEVLRADVHVTANDLLRMPSGGVTMKGLKYNIAVGILFIYSWFKGAGHFFFQGGVEDSATAEISRSQVWQWIYHEAQLEDDNRTITLSLVQELVNAAHTQLMNTTISEELIDSFLLREAAATFLEIVSKDEFPEFLTTYLNEEHNFLKMNVNSQMKAKL